MILFDLNSPSNLKFSKTVKVFNLHTQILSGRYLYDLEQEQKGRSRFVVQKYTISSTYLKRKNSEVRRARISGVVNIGGGLCTFLKFRTEKQAIEWIEKDISSL